MNIIGICGDNCIYCPRNIATQTKSAQKFDEVKELWVRLGLRDPAFPAQDLVCSGCKPENKCAYPEVRTCVYEKEIENCGFCRVYPCELINVVFERSEQIYAHATQVCTSNEMDALKKAFFSKRQNLDQARLNANERKWK